MLNGNGNGWWGAARRWIRGSTLVPSRRQEPVIGLALGGGFARGIAHVGVLRVFEKHKIPIGAVAGVSAGAMVAAAWASGADSYDIEKVARAMSFKDVARWKLSKLGLMGSERMAVFLERLLKCYRFEQMRIPLAVVASDILRGEPVVFREHGDVFLPIRASCSYPGLFLPIQHEDRYLVDGAMTMEIPAEPLRAMGATHVISVALPMQATCVNPDNMFSVVNRCFQILQRRTEREWRRHSSAVICPDVTTMTWDSFESAVKLIEAGEKAALAVLPRIQAWLPKPLSARPAIAVPADETAV